MVPTPRSCCTERHHERYTLKRPVIMVLFWNSLLWMTIQSLSEQDQFSITLNTDAPILENPKDYIIHFLINILWTVSAFLSAWLVGWKYKLHDLIIVGLVLTSLGILLDNIFQLPATATGQTGDQPWVKALRTISYAIVSIGSAPVVTNMLQLAIEQIPDASGNQLSSLVSWFLFSITLGSWLSSFGFEIYKNCITQSETKLFSEYLPCFKIIFAVLMTILLCSNFIFKHRLLDNTPISYSMRQIYQVLKYAFNTKLPKKRSALTYWENELPSGLNLGKSKYGGPFSNEQVEDVKTFIRISAFSVTAFLFLLAVHSNNFSIIYYTYDNGHRGWHKHMVNFTQHSPTCKTSLGLHFTQSTTWWQLIFILLYELIMAPAFAHRLPKMQHRMGFAGGTATLLCTVITTINSMDSFGCNGKNCNAIIHYYYFMTGIALFLGLVNTMFYIAGLEFICAQAPYAMRNFFITLGWCIAKSSSFIAGFLFSVWNSECKRAYCPTTYTLITLAISITGLVLLCIAIKKYRNRTRGHEDEYQQIWVEETYDKYIDDRIKQEETFIFTAK